MAKKNIGAKNTDGHDANGIKRSTSDPSGHLAGISKVGAEQPATANNFVVTYVERKGKANVKQNPISKTILI